MFRTNKHTAEEGFSLIELLVVIVIIGVLASIGLLIFLNQQKTSAEAAVKSDVRNTTAAVQQSIIRSPTSPDVTMIGVEPVITPGNDTSIVLRGAWNGYTVTGTSPHTNEGFIFCFNSLTGKFGEDCDASSDNPVDAVCDLVGGERACAARSEVQRIVGEFQAWASSATMGAHFDSSGITFRDGFSGMTPSGYQAGYTTDFQFVIVGGGLQGAIGYNSANGGYFSNGPDFQVAS